MSDQFYPVNPTLSMRIIVDNFKANPAYLEHSDWSEEDIAFLTSLLKGENPSEPASDDLVFGQHRDKYDTISGEATALYNEMATFRNSQEFKEATVAEKNSLLRTMTTLLDKLVSIDERARGLKYLSDFQNTLLDVIEDVMTPTQRTIIMERLRDVKQDAPRGDELNLESTDDVE